jgi:hypothetical protein
MVDRVAPFAAAPVSSTVCSRRHRYAATSIRCRCSRANATVGVDWGEPVGEEETKKQAGALLMFDGEATTRRTLAAEQGRRHSASGCHRRVTKRPGRLRERRGRGDAVARQ